MLSVSFMVTAAGTITRLTQWLRKYTEDDEKNAPDVSLKAKYNDKKLGQKICYMFYFTWHKLFKLLLLSQLFSVTCDPHKIFNLNSIFSHLGKCLCAITHLFWTQLKISNIAHNFTHKTKLAAANFAFAGFTLNVLHIIWAVSNQLVFYIST